MVKPSRLGDFPWAMFLTISSTSSKEVGLIKLWDCLGGTSLGMDFNYFGDCPLSVNLRFRKEVPIIIQNLLLDVLMFNFGAPILRSDRYNSISVPSLD
jgi:hypothetical protein